MKPGALPLAVALLLVAGCSNADGAKGDSYRRGVAALAAGQPRTARIEFLNAIQTRPNDPRIRLKQAETYLQLGDGVAAEAELERARKFGAKDAAHHLMAHAALLQGDLKRALDEAAATPPPYAAYAARVRGLALMQQGAADGAAAAFAKAVAGAPEDAPTWADLARFRRSIGEVAGAVAAADKAIALQPNDTGALLLRGELTRVQYGLKAALPWFDRALAIDPDDVDAILERAATLGELGRNAEMLESTRKVLALSPDHPTAYYLEAMLAARAHNYALARSLFDRTKGALDTLPAAMLLGGALAYQAGDYERATERLGQLVELQPDNAKARRLLAAAQWRSGNADAATTIRPLADRSDAESYALTLAARSGGKPAVLSGPLVFRDAAPGAPPEIGVIRELLAAGKTGDALARAKVLANDHPGSPDVHLLIGDTLGVQGDFAAAAEQYRKAANLAFTEPVALRLIDALERSGQGDAAAQVLQLFLDQNPQNVPAQLLAARSLLAARRWDEAIATYQSLRRRLGDRDAALLNNLAWARAKNGDMPAALPLARQAWTLDRSNPSTADTYGWLLFTSGKKNKAQGLALLMRAHGH